MNTIRIISILGASPYDPVCYRLGPDRPHCAPTPHMLRALMDLLDGDLRAAVICTDFAREKNLSAVLDELGDRADRVTPLKVEDGRDPSQQRALFNQVRELLRDEPLVALGETRPPDEIVLDVTHGFRVQPMLAMAALSEATTVWRRAGRAPRLRVLYGGYDPQQRRHLPLAEDHPGTWTPRPRGCEQPPPEPYRIAEVWDLTEFVRQGEWTLAVDALLRFGRGDDLEKLAREAAARTRGETADWLATTADMVRGFADTLCLAQAPQLVAERTRPLLQHLASRPEAVHEQKVLMSALDELSNKIEPLAADQPVAPDSLRAYQALAEWYLELQRFAEALTLSTEARGIYTAAAHGVPLYAVPGQRAFHGEWSRISDLQRRAGGPEVASEDPELRRSRHAVAHAGFHATKRETADLRTDVRRAVEAFAALPVPTASTADATPGAGAWILVGAHEVPRPAIEALRNEAGDRPFVEDLPAPSAKRRKTARALCEAGSRAAAKVMEHAPAKVFFGPGCGLGDVPLLAALQDAGVDCFVWEWTGAVDNTTGRKLMGEWLEAPTLRRLLP